MEKIIDSDVDRELFEKEIDVLKRSKVILDSDFLDYDSLISEYESLANNYEKILRTAIKITNIGDKSQQKLYFAMEKIRQQKKDIELKNKKLYKVSISDHLTKIYNRTFVIEKLEDEFEKSLTSNDSLCCILFDIDHFKKINDSYGHLVGDFVLEKLVKRVKDQLPEKCYFGRYGGEEFLIILPKFSLEESEEIALSIKDIVFNTCFIYNSIKINTTISSGIADNKSIKLKNVDELLQNADSAMYQAKNKGRNEIVTFKNKK